MKVPVNPIDLERFHKLADLSKDDNEATLSIYFGGGGFLSLEIVMRHADRKSINQILGVPTLEPLDTVAPETEPVPEQISSGA